MVTDFILDILQSLAESLIEQIPSMNFDFSWINNFAQGMSLAGYILDLPTLASVSGFVLSTEVTILLFKGSIRVWELIKW